MKTIAAAVTAAAALALGACGQNSGSAPANQSREVEAEANTADAANGTQNMQAALMNAPTGQRNVAFIRAILDAGIKCDRVEKSEKVADFRNMPTWRATCDDGKNYLIAVAPDGNATVVNRTDI